MHEGDAHTRLTCSARDSAKVVWFETHVAMQAPLAIQREQELRHDPSGSGRASTRTPKRETEIFLPLALSEPT